MKQIRTIINELNQQTLEYLPHVSSHKSPRKRNHDKEALDKISGYNAGREKEKLTATYY